MNANPNSLRLPAESTHRTSSLATPSHAPAGRRFSFVGWFVALLLALGFHSAVAQPVAIAHWTFDASSLTVAEGNITNFADATGNRDAYVTPNPLGPNNRISAPFTTADSVAGKFGEAIRFNGNNFLVFSNLVELMQANGNPSYSISMWVRWLNPTAPVGNTCYRTLSDWGNQTPGTPNVNSDHVYGFGPNGATTIRGQTRRPGAGAGGVDIYSRNATATVTDGEWHMLTWTFDTTSGELNTYFDGELIDTFTASSPFTMADSVSPLGAFGIKADDATAPFLEADTQLDEVWVILGVLSPDEVAQLHDINAIIPLGKNVTWQGGANSDWDLLSANWLPEAGPATTFETGDVVLFNDAASVNNVNLTTHLLPWSVTVNNNSLAYTFSGSGRLATAADGLTKQGSGTLILANSGNNTFPQVTISDGVLQVGNGGSAGDLGSGNILNNASLVVNRTGSLTLSGNIAGTGTVTKTGAGNLILNGANTYSGTTLVTGGTLTLGAGASLSASTPVAIANSSFDVAAVTPLTLSGGQALNLTNATLTVALADATDAVTTPTLAVNGTVTVNVATMPELLTYPQQFTAVKYTTAQGTATYQLGTLPPTLSVAYQGYLSNNVANNSIDVVITNGPAAVFWAGYAGGLNSSWNLATANWKTEAGAFTTYSDGLPATFNDAASNSTVTLEVVVSPTSLAVNNSALNYTFNGGSHISGPGALTKDGTGSLVLNNSGVNDFTGGVTINAGTLQVGNNDTAGNLPATGPVVNNGSLVFARADDVAVPNVISGAGSISHISPAVLTISAANSAFTGPVSVTQGTLRTGNGAALGTADGATTIASGATLDVSGQILNVEPIIVSGAGVNGLGAIVNSGAGQINALRDVTLAGHTTFGGDNRWDIRLGGGLGELSTGGNNYHLTKIGGNQVSLVSLIVDPALGNVDIQSGILAMEANCTSLGNPANTLTIRAGAMFQLFNTTNLVDKIIVSEEGATIRNGAGVGRIVGPINFASDGGYHTVDAAGTSLTLSGALTGGGIIYKAAGGSPLILDGNSPSFAGGGFFNVGTVTLNGTLNNVLGVILTAGRFNVNGALTGAGAVTTYAGTTLAGSGTISGAVDVGGTLLPGDTGVAGTLTTGNLTVQAGVGLTFDLNSVTTVGGGVNDLILVNGDLTLNDNDFTINAIGATGLTAGTYRLMTYTGSLVGSFGTAMLPGGAGRYSLMLTHNVGAKSIDLVVTGTSHVLEWNNASGSGAWDVNVSQNWSNRTTSAAMDYFFASDEVLFTDSIITAPNSTTTVALSGAVSPSLTTVNSSTNYTITGPGGISGGGGVVKQGSSTLTIASTNNFTGPVAVQAGTVRVANNGALGLVPGGAVTVSAGATLDVGGNPTANNANYGAKQIYVAGTGVGGNGAIINSGTVAQQNSFQRVTLTGDATFGGPGDAAAAGNPGRWDIRGGTPALDLGGFTLTKIGANQVTFVGVAITGGDIVINNGILAAETTTSFTGGGTITVNSGGTLGHFRNNSGLFNRPITLNGGIIRNLATSGAATVNSSPITLVADSTLQGSTSGGYPISFTNVISQSGGSYGITKTGAGAVILTANHTYSGATRINAGAIQLVDSGNLPNSSLISIASGASLNVAGRTDGTLTLNSGQTLAGNGTVTGNLVVGNGAIVSPGVSSAGTLIVAGNVTFQAGSTAFMELNKAPVENDQVRATAGTATTITYGGTLELSLLGGALEAGDSFRLFVATNYVGSFSSIVPATPGAGLVWDTTGLTNGTLRVAAPPAPSISGLTFSGGNVVISGTGGTPNAEYRVLTTTDLTLPLANWTPIFTNTFDGLGNFSYTNGAPTGAQRFYTVFEP